MIENHFKYFMVVLLFLFIKVLQYFMLVSLFSYGSIFAFIWQYQCCCFVLVQLFSFGSIFDFKLQGSDIVCFHMIMSKSKTVNASVFHLLLFANNFLQCYPLCKLHLPGSQLKERPLTYPQDARKNKTFLRKFTLRRKLQKRQREIVFNEVIFIYFSLVIITIQQNI